jgi:protein-S-isoprenylcysteine O-methyltransferase Ste14
MDISTLFYPIIALWVGSEFVLLRILRTGADGESRDRASLTVLWTTIGLCTFAAGWLADSGVGLWPASAAQATAAVGIGLIVAGMALRWASILTLRRYFTVNVAILSDHKLVDTGLYRLVRHPSYTGMLLSFLGLGVALGSWVSLLLTTVPTALALLNRIRIEERALADGLGEPYRAYCQRTPRLVPGFF